MSQSLSEDSLELDDEEEDDSCFFCCFFFWLFPCSFLGFLLFFLLLFSFFFFFFLLSSSSDDESDLFCFFFFFFFFVASSLDDDADLNGTSTEKNPTFHYHTVSSDQLDLNKTKWNECAIHKYEERCFTTKQLPFSWSSVSALLSLLSLFSIVIVRTLRFYGKTNRNAWWFLK